jgi:serine/threonine protein kinase
MNILEKLQHKNIVQLFDSFETRNHMCFVMELCGGGDLLSYVRRRKRLTEETTCFLFK